MLRWPNKDPNEVIDYPLDWADPERPRLEVGETLTSSEWSVVEGTVVIDQVKTGYAPSGLSKVWLSGGTIGEDCILLNRVTTSMDRTYDQSVAIRIKGR